MYNKNLLSGFLHEFKAGVEMASTVKTSKNFLNYFTEWEDFLQSFEFSYRAVKGLEFFKEKASNYYVG